MGAATVRSLARQGCSVLINYAQSASEAAGVRADAEGCGVKAGLFQGDVSQDEVCRGLVDAAVEMFGRLDILINNAGTTEFIPADDFDSVNDEVWSRLMDVNVKAAFQCVRAQASVNGNCDRCTFSKPAASAVWRRMGTHFRDRSFPFLSRPRTKPGKKVRGAPLAS